MADQDETIDPNLPRFDYEIKVGPRFYTDEIAATSKEDAEAKLRNKYRERGEVIVLSISPT